jgi:hypothetical protein
MSHLSNAGLADWVAPNLEAYIDLAVAKALDVGGLAALRSRLRVQTKASPLCDALRFGHNLGAALRHAWIDWCRCQSAGLNIMPDVATQRIAREEPVSCGDDQNGAFAAW